MSPLHHFLLVYQTSTGDLLRADDLGTDTDEAVQAYADCEARYRGDSGIEIVLIGADSLETVKVTHSHYFPDDLGRAFFDSVLV